MIRYEKMTDEGKRSVEGRMDDIYYKGFENEFSRGQFYNLVLLIESVMKKNVANALREVLAENKKVPKQRKKKVAV